MLKGLDYIHSRSISHGDIRPQLIGIDKQPQEDGQLMEKDYILDRLADPSPLERIQSQNIILKRELYMSPEVWKKLQGKDKTAKYNAFANDLYSLGLVMLQAGVKGTIQDIYQPKGEFGEDKLQEKLTHFCNKYQRDNFLCALVKIMLKTKESERLDTKELLNNFERRYEH